MSFSISIQGSTGGNCSISAFAGKTIRPDMSFSLPILLPINPFFLLKIFICCSKTANLRKLSGSVN